MKSAPHFFSQINERLPCQARGRVRKDSNRGQKRQNDGQPHRCYRVPYANGRRRYNRGCVCFGILLQRKHRESIGWRPVDSRLQIVKEWMFGLPDGRQIDSAARRNFNFCGWFSDWNIEGTRFRTLFRLRFRSGIHLTGPNSDLFTNSVRQLSESQAAVFSCLIDPCQLADGLDPGGRIDRKAEMDRSICSHRRDRAKGQASLGNIHDNPAIIRRQAEVSEMFRHFPYAETSFVRHHGITAPESRSAIAVTDGPRNRAGLALQAKRTSCKFRCGAGREASPNDIGIFLLFHRGSVKNKTREFFP